MSWKLTSVSVVIFVVVGGAGFWLDRHFEEPEAEYVPSLAGHLAAKSVLGVLAHPDDEISIAGLLAEAASRSETNVRTLTLTRGEAGLPGEPISKPEHLPVIRTAELYKFGFLLRLDDQEVLDYPDGKLEDQALASLVKDIVGRIRRWKPDLVVTFDPSTGLTLHPDHMAVGAATTEAVSLAGDHEFEPSLGDPYSPRWLAYIVGPRRILMRFGGEAGREIAAKQPTPEYAVPADWRLKAKGWEVHESQRHVIRQIFGLPPSLLYWFYDKEHYSLRER